MFACTQSAIPLYYALTAAFPLLRTAGFTSFTVDTGSQSSSTTSETLRAAGGNNRLFVPYKAVDVLPYNKLVSATLVSANQVVVALPGVSKLWVDSNTARPPLVAASDCVSMLGIAAVSTTTPLLSDRLSSCSLAADFKSITLTLASSTSYVAGKRLKGTNCAH